MADLAQSLRLFGPELVIVTALIVLFLMDSFLPIIRNTFVPIGLTMVGCLIAAGATAGLFDLPQAQFFSKLLANDSFANFFRYLFFFTTGVSAYLAFGSKSLLAKDRMEFCLLLLSVAFGLCLMATSTHLLTLYIGIETVSIISFVMAGFKKDSLRANEASFKYLVFGALASGLMLYGFSLLYGLTGSLEYSAIAAELARTSAPTSLKVFICALIYSGIAYKISAFPLHFWTPDVYEGAPTPVVAFFSVGPKAAGIAAMGRLFVAFFGTSVNGTLNGLTANGLSIIPAIAILAALTMTVGNLSAIGQTNVKRLLAYSSIAHVGYMLMAFVTPDFFGLGALIFYLIAYCLMNLGAFWVVSLVSDLKGNESLEAFQGMGWTMPVMGVCMAVFLLSLAGMPLFSGFVGKFYLFGAVVKTPGYLWLAVIGVLNSVVSLYYYAKIMRAMWLEKAESSTGGSLPLYHGVALVGLAIPTIVMGIYFAPVMRFVERSLATFL